MDWVPLRPGEVRNCVKCGGQMTSKGAARKLGITPHRSNGICGRCYKKPSGKYIPAVTKLSGPLDLKWRKRAACAGADPSRFEERRMPGTAKRAPEDIQQTAIRYCLNCPVRQECRKEADQNRFCGLFGGVFRTLSLQTGKNTYRTFDALKDVSV